MISRELMAPVLINRIHCNRIHAKTHRESFSVWYVSLVFVASSGYSGSIRASVLFILLILFKATVAIRFYERWPGRVKNDPSPAAQV